MTKDEKVIGIIDYLVKQSREIQIAWRDSDRCGNDYLFGCVSAYQHAKDLFERHSIDELYETLAEKQSVTKAIDRG